MNNKNIFLFLVALVILLNFVSAGSFSATGSSARFVTTQSYPSLNNLYSGGDINTYWPILGNDEMCKSREDILLQIAPAGCQPTVVRSDLLGEQNVPVLCQIQAFQINPLIDIQSIDSMTFSGRYPKEVSTVGYYPAKAALSTGNKLSNSALINNVGYMVVVLKRQQNESSLPESVNLNLTATLRYDSYNSLGVGQAYFILGEQTESDFKNSSFKNSFWQGRYYLKAEAIDSESALISLYYQDRKITTMNVLRGQQSSEIFVPGFSTCQASLRLAYDGYESSGSDRARIEVQQGNKKTDVFDVYNGMSFANGKCRVTGRIVANSDGTGTVSISCSGGRASLSLSQSENAGEQFVDESKLDENSKAHLKYLRNAISEYRSVAEDYPSEYYSLAQSGVVYYGEDSLKAAFDLIKNSGKGQYLKNEYSELIALATEKYPDSKTLSIYPQSYNEISKMDSSESSAVFDMDNTYVTVRVVDFTKAQQTTEVKFRVRGKDMTYSMDRENTNSPPIFTLDENLNYKFTVSSVNSEYVTIRPDCPNYKGNSYSETLREGESTSICGISVRVDNINAEKLAIVRVIPKVDNTQTKTNISVSIGIEKRAIQLSPEKANQVIENLNESINKFESISDRLSETAKGLKTACFATAAVLTAKNFISGMDGTASARKQVMQGDNGWNQRCAKAFSSQQASKGMVGSSYVSVDDCLRQNADLIKNEVESVRVAREKADKNLDSVTEKRDTAVFGTTIDISGSKYIEKLKENYGDSKTTIIVRDGEEVEIGDFVNDLQAKDGGKDAYTSNLITLEDLKKIEVNTLILQSNAPESVTRQAASLELTAIAERYVENRDNLLAKNSITGKLGLPANANVITISGPSLTSNVANQNTYDGVVYSTSMGWTGKSIPDKTPIQIFRLDSKQYVAILDRLTGPNNDYSIKEIFELVDKDVRDADPTISSQIKSAVPRLTKLDASDYTNAYSNPVVKFYDSGSSKGMPAVVPVDVDNGWYAGVQQFLPTTTGGQSSYQSSGQVSSFFICNVFKNELEEFDKLGFGDDRCTQINLYTGQAITVGALDATKSRQLIANAQQAILQASKQYASGVKEVKINGKSYKVENQVSVPGVRCQDFMSPKECLLLYNLCDPVICPTSRCNFGGQYHVSNVAASGIAGSLLLCLPNVQEKIILPVCLTGLSAGLDSYVSVLKTYRSCLQENIETGRTVGVCDEIYSIYMCDFFWKQAIPLTKSVLPKILASAYGTSQTQGGGEYLNVMGAWQNTQESINYFTQTYAVNSLDAFRARSIDEAGTDFCKAFASIKAPTAFDSLVETDSPPQFSAWFSSDKYSDATVPATARYKVFYHIFAGKDSGVSYQVYLKNPTAVSVVSIPQSVAVASGYITRGEYQTETKDFTAPEGYRELCVNVNGKEECGFGKVTTSFAIDYLSDQARAEAITQSGITSAASCVSGSVGTGVSPTLNLQSAVESTIDPEIYKQGIIRICATDNPGSTSAPGRYIDVGHCGDEKLRCWLDSESTARAITTENAGTKEEIQTELEQLEKANQAQLLSIGEIYDSDTFKSKYDEIEALLSAFKSNNALDTLSLIQVGSEIVLTRIVETEKKSPTAQQKAKLYISKGNVYSAAAEKVFSLIKKPKDVAPASQDSNKNTANEEIVYNNIFLEYQDGTIARNVVYYYSSSGWKYSLAKDVNYESPNFDSWQLDSSTYSRDVDFIKTKIEGKTYSEGLSALAKRAIDNKDGSSILSNSALKIVFVNNKQQTKEIDLKYDDAKLKELYSFINSNSQKINSEPSIKTLSDFFNVKVSVNDPASTQVGAQPTSQPAKEETSSESQDLTKLFQEYNEAGNGIIIKLDDGIDSSTNLKYRFNIDHWEVSSSPMDGSEVFYELSSSMFENANPQNGPVPTTEKDISLIHQLRGVNFYRGAMVLLQNLKNYGGNAELKFGNSKITVQMASDEKINENINLILESSGRNVPEDMPPLSQDEIDAEKQAEVELKNLNTEIRIISNDITEGNQFYPDMRFAKNPVTYFVDETCPEVKKNAIENAINSLSSKTIIRFEKSLTNNENVNIEFDCVPGPGGLSKYDRSHTVLGTTSISSNGLVSQVGKYMIFEGVSTIYLYEYSASECNWNDVALHELIHAFGFGHKSDTNSLMYYSYDNQKEYCLSGNIDQDIIDKLNELYVISSVNN